MDKEIIFYRTAAEKDIYEFTSSPLFWEIVVPCLGFIILVGLGIMFFDSRRRK